MNVMKYLWEKLEQIVPFLFHWSIHLSSIVLHGEADGRMEFHLLARAPFVSGSAAVFSTPGCLWDNMQYYHLHSKYWNRCSSASSNLHLALSKWTKCWRKLVFNVIKLKYEITGRQWWHHSGVPSFLIQFMSYNVIKAVFTWNAYMVLKNIFLNQ